MTEYPTQGNGWTTTWLARRAHLTLGFVSTRQETGREQLLSTKGGLPPGSSPSGWLHRLFRVGMGLKGLDGILEITGGLLLGALGAQGVSGTVAFLTQHELSEDPHDFLANLFVRFSDHLQVGAVHFATLYLLVHGVVKIGLAAALLKERLWAFPVGMGFLGLFTLYQLYRFSFTRGIGLGLLTVLDLGVLLLVWKEYRALRSLPGEDSR